MMSMGRDRYKARSDKLIEKGHLSNTSVGQSLMRQVIGPFAEALEEEIKGSLKVGSRERHIGRRYTKLLGVDVTALLTTQTIIDTLIREPSKLIKVSQHVGNALEAELMFEFVAKNNKEDWMFFLDDTKDFQPKYRRKKIVTHIVAKKVANLDRIKFNDRYSWGLWLTKIFQRTTGLIEIYDNMLAQRRSSKHTPPKFVAFSPDCTQWLNETLERHEELFPLYLPTFQKPRPWKNPYEGGYPDTVTMRSGIVKRIPYRRLANYNTREMSGVFKAVNRLQRVPWVLNEDVFELARHFWEIDQPVDKIPHRQDLLMPEAPHDVDYNEESRFNYRKELAVVHRQNVGMRSHRSQFMRILLMGNNLKGQTFHYPYNLDFRGRVYPIPAFLCPQGTTMAKAMLDFKEAKPISSKDGSADWLAIHGANVWGLDKKSFSERINWVHDNQELIKDIAKDPLGCTTWRDADEPLGFARWCLEWAAYMDHGEGFMSRMPVHMDGTNNGLQLFSLIMRDEKEAKATNVSPGDYPQDIYQDIANAVTERMRGSENEHAAFWMKFFDGGAFPRAATKRPVMTFPYGATMRSCGTYLMDWLEETMEARLGGRRDLLRARCKENWHHINFLGPIIWEEIHKSLSGSVKAMSWLRQCAKTILTTTEKDIRWTAPSGFPVIQEYLKTKPTQITTRLGEQIKLMARMPVPEIAVRKNIQAISANYIHSIDASLLMGAVNRAYSEGVSSVAPVHDDFGTHAADAPTMARCIREEAAEMFSGNLLEDLKRELEGWAGVDLEEPPVQGNLDPNCVLESNYFFS